MPNTKEPNVFITIDLGNAAMRSAEDVARAQHQIANTVLECDPGHVFAASVRDLNGNVVGRWSVLLPEGDDT